MIYFISGHRDITVKDFFKHYKKPIDKAIKESGIHSHFVVGDCMGVDIMAMTYLAAKNIRNVTIYHMFEEPRYYQYPFGLRGGYVSDVDRDLAMTIASDVDIAWTAKGRERSGTGQNIERRIWVEERKKKGLTYTLKDIQVREANNFL